MHGDLTAFDARVAALNASVAFTAAARRGFQQTLDEDEIDSAIAATLATAERFEQWLTRPEPDPTAEAL